MEQVQFMKEFARSFTLANRAETSGSHDTPGIYVFLAANLRWRLRVNRNIHTALQENQEIYKLTEFMHRQAVIKRSHIHSCASNPLAGQWIRRCKNI